MFKARRRKSSGGGSPGVSPGPPTSGYSPEAAVAAAAAANAVVYSAAAHDFYSRAATGMMDPFFAHSYMAHNRYVYIKYKVSGRFFFDS
jgi:hypothetical protein